MEFHISRHARETYGFDDALFSLTGNVVFANYLATRVFAKAMNDKRNLARNPEKAILPGQLNAMGLIDEILHYVAELYREEHGLDLFARCLDSIGQTIGVAQLDEVLLRFVQQFPNVDVHQGKITPQDFLSGKTGDVSHREMILEEVLLLWLANANPAFGPFLELFDDRELRAGSAYVAFMEALKNFFAVLPPFGPDHQTLVDMLRSPAVAVPFSLYGQLQYIKERWGLLLGRFLMRLLGSLDFMKEEERLFWKGGGLKSEGYDSSLSFGGLDVEPERFSLDKEWMPRVILLAKSTLVWLDQLSKKYGREIRTLDKIPDEEIDTIARRGFNALWLIGLWERSKASKRIKQMCGNPEAEASAYSLYDYDIAAELGGWTALGELRGKCLRRGIRLASDMVPNHTAMDSLWISQHPDWFLQLDHCPFPNYTFGGADLSQDPAIEIKLEDHYYERSDAAVVFLHRDKRNGRTRFIYHGNDGTSMPWNDTAQLNYLNSAAREAIIQVILHVARNFPIIRFDAAMTLAKKHIQRLWFPQPGSGGDIATRAEYGLTKEAFDQAMPQEFWREVVDRVASEVPDTLLLAEAFWMMEGYFVRTLGMHRVYNSAFMHMFKKEENEKYRYTIKNTLEFDPDILKRFVNFMNNPDEETAAVQFGTGDKYFGVAAVMVTMPGTPMFGHGQVEGFREKYGMEYRRAYWEEKDDLGLMERHEREIFPLMHRRALFAEVANFYLYDLWTSHGTVNQNVFAYSNGTSLERALVFYNNSFERAVGWIKASAGYAVKNPDGTKTIQQKNLSEALGLHDDGPCYLLMRDQTSGLIYVRASRDLINSGLYVELNGYQHQVFWDLQEVQDSSSYPIARLCNELNGAGVFDIHEAMMDMTHRSIYQGFNEVFNPGSFRSFAEAAFGRHPMDKGTLGDLHAKLSFFFWRSKEFANGQGDPEKAVVTALKNLQGSFDLVQSAQRFADQKSLTKAAGILDTRLREPSTIAHVFFAKALLDPLAEAIDKNGDGFLSKSYVESWLLDRKVLRIFLDLGMPWVEAHHAVQWLRILLENRGWARGLTLSKVKEVELLEQLVRNPEVRNLMGVHDYDGKVWFSKEGFDYVLWWFFASAVQENMAASSDVQVAGDFVRILFQMIEDWKDRAEKGGFLLEALISTAEPSPAPEKKVAKKSATKKTGGD
ncbi:MAG: alpha-amylase [Spirochaetales bacterium]|nr:alpha-amylase [Spirochaetales bacterium]